MKPYLAILCLALGISAPLVAFGAESLRPLPMDETFFNSGKNPTLTPQEREALAIAKKWQNGEGSTLKPVQGSDGSIRFLFGAQQPSVICAVMQITDIELEPGETINSLHIGDAARWLVEPAVTGSGVAEVQHIVIKPMDVGLETSLMVTTNRRSYHVRLKSHKNQYMPRVSFIYADALAARWEARKTRQKEEKEKQTIPESGEYLGNLDFTYRISGDGVKPLRVYNDGVKTIIQMPQMSEAPTLLIMSDGEEVLTNYRLQADRYIVDSLFNKAILIAGVGSKQRKTVITRGH